jgi:hypothetical protein
MSWRVSRLVTVALTGPASSELLITLVNSIVNASQPHQRCGGIASTSRTDAPTVASSHTLCTTKVHCQLLNSLRERSASAGPLLRRRPPPDTHRAMSSEEDGADLMASFKKGSHPNTKAKTPPLRAKRPSFSPSGFVSEQSSGEDELQSRAPQANVRRAVAVKVMPVRNREQYTYYAPKEALKSIVREYQGKGDLMYEVKLTSGITKQVRSATG